MREQKKKLDLCSSAVGDWLIRDALIRQTRDVMCYRTSQRNQEEKAMNVRKQRHAYRFRRRVIRENTWHSVELRTRFCAFAGDRQNGRAYDLFIASKQSDTEFLRNAVAYLSPKKARELAAALVEMAKFCDDSATKRRKP